MKHGFWHDETAEFDSSFLRDSDAGLSLDLWSFDPDDVSAGWQREAIPQVGSAAIDQLIANLSSPFSNVAYTAAEVLGMAHDRRAIKPLLPLVDHPDTIVRYKAVGALLRLAGRPLVERLLPLLLETLESRHAILRALTVEDLGYTADRRAVEPLIERLQNDWDSQVRAFAARGLGEVGAALGEEESAESDKAVGQITAALIAALNITDPSVHAAVTEGLTRLGTLAVPPLLAYLDSVAHDTDKRAGQAGAIRALGNIGASDAWTPLAAMLADAEPMIRYQSAKALSRLDSDRAIDVLAGLVQTDTSHDVRAQAIQLIGRMALTHPANANVVAGVGPVLRHALEDTHGLVRLHATRVVVQLATAERDPWHLPYADMLLERFGDSHSHVRAAACAAFSNQGFLAAHRATLPMAHILERLGAMLHDEAPRTRTAAISALAQISLITRVTIEGDALPPGVVADLMTCLGDESQAVCDAAAHALGQLASLLTPDERDRVTGFMIARISEPNAAALNRSNTVWALGQLGDVRAIEPLILLFDDPDWLLHEPVVHAVLKIDPAQALAELGRRLRADKPAGLRNAIGVALAQIKDPRTLPLLQRVLELMLEDEQMLRRDGSGPLSLDQQPADGERLVHRTASGELFARQIIELAVRELEAGALG